MPVSVPMSAAPMCSPRTSGRLVERSHRDDDAQHRRDDAQRRQRLGDRRHRGVRLHLVLADGADLLLHQRLDLVRAGIADDGQPHVVADELGQFLVLEDVRKVLEQRRILRIVDMRLDLGARPRPQVAQQREQQAEQRQEVLALGHLVGDRLDGAADRVLDRRERVAHHEDAGGDAADDEELEGLPQDEDVAAFADKAARQRADAHHKTEYEVQATRLPD